MAANSKSAKQSQRRPSSPVEFSKQERKRFLRLLQDIHLKSPAQKLGRCKEPGGRFQVRGETPPSHHQGPTKAKLCKESTGDKRGKSRWNQDQVKGGRPKQPKKTHLRDGSEEHIQWRQEPVILANSTHTGARPKQPKRTHLVDQSEEDIRWGKEQVTFKQHPKVRSEFPKEQIVDLTRTAKAPRKGFQVHQGTEAETQRGDYFGQRRVNINQGTTPFTKEQGTQAHLPCLAHKEQWEKVWGTHPSVEETPEVEHKGLLWTRKEQAGGRGGPSGPGGQGGRGLGDQQGTGIAPPPGFSAGSRRFSGAKSQEFCQGSGGFFEERAPQTGQQTTSTDNTTIIYFPYQTKNLSHTDLFYLKQISAESLGEKLSNLNSQLLRLSL